MAVINANCLAIYYDNVASQSKAGLLAPFANTTAALAGTSQDFAKVIVADADATSGENNVFVDYGAITGGGATFPSGLSDLVLVGAATSSTLDLSNTIEDVARDGSGGTLQESDQEWSIQAEGLIQNANDAGSDILDMARNKYYALVKFQIEKGVGTTNNYYGQVLIESASITGGVDEIATYSVTMRGVGAMLKA